MVKLPERTRRPRAPRLVFVDNGKREYLDALKAAGYKMTSVSSVKKALAVKPRPDGLILELLVPDADLSLLSSAMKLGRSTRAMTLIALASANRKRAVTKAGATFCLYPCPPEQLLKIVKRAMPLPEPRKGGR